MRAYVVTTGAVFGLITVVHLWRLVKEGAHMASDPWFLLFTVVAAVLGLWALRLLRSRTP